MALIQCPDCTRDVSTTASSCPHCGYVITAAPSAARRRPTYEEDYDDESEDDSRRRYRRSLPHSGPGIASFVVAILAGLLIAAMFVGAIGLAIAHGPNARDMPKQWLMVIGFAALGGMGIAFFGAILGFTGLVVPERKKIFAVLGLIFNGVIILGVLLLILLGMLNKH
jgi:hypothetical protein